VPAYQPSPSPQQPGTPTLAAVQSGAARAAAADCSDPASDAEQLLDGDYEEQRLLAIATARSLLAGGAEPDVIAAQFSLMPTTPPTHVNITADGIDFREITELVLLRQSPSGQGNARRILVQPLVACWLRGMPDVDVLRNATEGDACVGALDASLLTHAITYYRAPGQQPISQAQQRARAAACANGALPILWPSFYRHTLAANALFASRATTQARLRRAAAMGMSVEELEMHDALGDDERPMPVVGAMSAEATRRAAASATFLAAAGQSRKAFRKFDQRADSEIEPSRARRREFERKTPRGPPVDPALVADVLGHEPFKLHVTTFDSVLPDLPRARLLL
jgi:hypothetical protein